MKETLDDDLTVKLKFHEEVTEGVTRHENKAEERQINNDYKTGGEGQENLEDPTP